MTALALAVGDQLKFDDSSRYWWTVRAVDERYVVLTRHAPFRSSLLYTIADAQTGRRGPCDLIGQGWDFDKTNDQTLATSAERLLVALHGGMDTVDDESLPHDERVFIPAVEISHRNNVPTRIIERKTR